MTAEGLGPGRERGMEALRTAVARLLVPDPWIAVPVGAGGPGILLAESLAGDLPAPRGTSSGPSRPDRDERERVVSLVERARGGEAEAFGLLFDHYQRPVYGFLLRRTRSVSLAEDLTSETFVRALRSLADFRWQGRDFGAWLMTIARNLAIDHARSGHARLELSSDDVGAEGRSAADTSQPGPESAVLARLTSEILLRTLAELPEDQRDCLVLRFIEEQSVSETASVLGRSDGAVKQLQLRALRHLARLLPDEVRG